MAKKSNNKRLSILIPVYNYVCVELVDNLHRQAEACGAEYEIIVADDGSTDSAVTEANRAIDSIGNATYIIRCKNAGRAAIRNFLAQQASYEWLIFLDCDIALPDDRFIRRYLDAADGSDVTDGGVCTDGDPKALRGNLRFIYERASEAGHTCTERMKHPYRCFRTTNFMISRDAMLVCPFDERFRHYGYEDVLFGKQLREGGRTICHIDNPVAIRDFEPNDVFIAKTEEGLRTLYNFRDELRGYSHMLDVIDRLRRVVPLCLPRLWHRLFGAAERSNLTGRRPRLRLFDLYRMGYYLSLTK